MSQVDEVLNLIETRDGICFAIEKLTNFVRQPLSDLLHSMSETLLEMRTLEFERLSKQFFAVSKKLSDAAIDDHHRDLVLSNADKVETELRAIDNVLSQIGNTTIDGVRKVCLKSIVVKTNNFLVRSQGRRPRPSPFLPRSRQHRASNVKDARCSFCGQGHFPWKCTEFLESNVPDRRALVEAVRCCIKCLRLGHQSQDCGYGNCKKCGRIHNTMLHDEEGNLLSTLEPPSAEGNVELLAEPDVRYLMSKCFKRWPTTKFVRRSPPRVVVPPVTSSTSDSEWAQLAHLGDCSVIATRWRTSKFHRQFS